jgi:MFS family permease
MSPFGKDPRDQFYKRNILGLSAVEFLWGIGMPVIIESTFLQLFLRSLGASNRTIGLIPALSAAGIAFFSLASSFLTSHLAHKRRAVILAHLFSSLPIIAYGIALSVLPGQSALPAFFIAYIIFSISLGITVPVWQNFLVMLFSDRKTFPALSIMMTTQIGTRLVGSLIILKMVEHHALSLYGASIVFTLVGVVFFFGSFFFLLVKEIPLEKSKRRSAHTFRTLIAAAKDIIHNRNYIFFWLSSPEVSATITAISFYANYATEFYHIPTAVAAGLFVAVIYSGATFTNIVFGWFDLFTLKTKFIIAKSSSAVAIIILLFARTLPEFLIASFLLGIARGVTQLAYSPAIKRLSGLDDATDYFSLSQIIFLPFSFGIPFASGMLIDYFSPYGTNAYRIVFSVLLCLVFTGIFFLLKTDFDAARKRLH